MVQKYFFKTLLIYLNASLEPVLRGQEEDGENSLVEGSVHSCSLLHPLGGRAVQPLLQPTQFPPTSSAHRYMVTYTISTSGRRDRLQPWPAPPTGWAGCPATPPAYAAPALQLCKQIHYHTQYHTIPYHTIPCHTIPYQTIPYHTIPVLRIHDILVWIRIRGSMPLTNGSGSCYFRH